MRVLLVASEVTPLAKSGGLGDVAAALPRALAAQGHDVRVAMPRYGWIPATAPGMERVRTALPVPFPGVTLNADIYRGWLPDASGPKSAAPRSGAGAVPVYFIDQPTLYDRPELYGEGGVDYPDNALRFAFFDRAVIEMLRDINWRPDVIHCNDWQTGLVAAYLKCVPELAADPFFADTRLLFTIHNLGYQGHFPPATVPAVGLPWSVYDYRQMEFYGQANFLKAGVAYGDRTSTVSVRYAQEVTTSAFGCGLEGFLRMPGHQPLGILNGVDMGEWDPAADPIIAVNYDADDLSGKAACKAALQQRVGFPNEPRVPLLGVVSRLETQKGIDLLEPLFPLLESLDARFVLLGSGRPEYQRMLRRAQLQYPERVRVRTRFDADLAHEIEAGVDIFLMPSRYEPCGLNQMYSMKYGTVPVVRATGGLADTVIQATPESLADGTATGFRFDEALAPDFLRCVSQAVEMYHSRPDAWRVLQRNGMRRDFSWGRAAREYEALYREMCSGGGAERGLADAPESADVRADFV